MNRFPARGDRTVAFKRHFKFNSCSPQHRSAGRQTFETKRCKDFLGACHARGKYCDSESQDVVGDGETEQPRTQVQALHRFTGEPSLNRQRLRTFGLCDGLACFVHRNVEKR